MSVPDLCVYLPDEAATARLGQVIAAFMEPGIALLLYGDLGMGKSVLARAIVQTLAPGVTEVPSPTFTIMLSYDTQSGGGICWHIDLYRIEEQGDLQELGLDDIFEDSIALVEWPQRLGDDLPYRHIACHFAVAPDNAGRMVTFRFSPSLSALGPQVADAISCFR